MGFDYAGPVFIVPPPNPNDTTVKHLTGAGSTLIKTGSGWLSSININTPATSSATLTVYDGVDASGSVLGILDISKQAGTTGGFSPWPFQTGLFVVQSAVADITIIAH